jgi:hypothetical protein
VIYTWHAHDKPLSCRDPGSKPSASSGVGGFNHSTIWSCRATQMVLGPAHGLHAALWVVQTLKKSRGVSCTSTDCWRPEDVLKTLSARQGLGIIGASRDSKRLSYTYICGLCIDSGLFRSTYKRGTHNISGFFQASPSLKKKARKLKYLFIYILLY